MEGTCRNCFDVGLGYRIVQEFGFQGVRDIWTRT